MPKGTRTYPRKSLVSQSHKRKEAKQSMKLTTADRREGGARPLYLVGFDFDLTLSCVRVYGRRHFDQMSALFGGRERIALLRTFMAFLVHHRVRIVVISWNFEQIIHEALTALGLVDLVHSIYDRRSMVAHGGYSLGKKNIVNELCMLSTLSKENVVFVDDDSEILANMDCKTVCVNEAAGMTLRDMQLVAAKMNLVFDPESSGNN